MMSRMAALSYENEGAQRTRRFARIKRLPVPVVVAVFLPAPRGAAAAAPPIGRPAFATAPATFGSATFSTSVEGASLWRGGRCSVAAAAAAKAAAAAAGEAALAGETA